MSTPETRVEDALADEMMTEYERLVREHGEDAVESWISDGREVPPDEDDDQQRD